MSIAVSAIVRPSPFVTALIVLMALLVSSIGIVIGFGVIGEIAFPVRIFLSVILGFLAFFGFYHGMQCRKTIQLDISGMGQLRITEVDPNASCMNENWPHVRTTGEVFRLQSDSTLWPNLLLLRLKNESGKTVTVPVLPDCVSNDDFRSLAVALRWIAMHNSPTKCEKF